MSAPSPPAANARHVVMNLDQAGPDDLAEISRAVGDLADRYSPASRHRQFWLNLAGLVRALQESTPDGGDVR